MTIPDKLRFIRNTACFIVAAEAALVAYCQSQGSLDIRFYTTREQQYQAQLHKAEAEVARYAVSGGQYEDDTQLAQADKAQPSVWDALATKHHHGR
jgi:hypothetical protein